VGEIKGYLSAEEDAEDAEDVGDAEDAEENQRLKEKSLRKADPLSLLAPVDPSLINTPIFMIYIESYPRMIIFLETPRTGEISESMNASPSMTPCT
jgi:hypothetical protein